MSVAVENRKEGLLSLEVHQEAEHASAAYPWIEEYSSVGKLLLQTDEMLLRLQVVVARN